MKFYKVSEKELRRLLYAKEELESLKCAGVDNWDGYGLAFDAEWNEGMKEDEDWDEYINRFIDSCLSEYKEIE